MASSAFKSASRRGSVGSDTSPRKKLSRGRSLSVSAVSRAQQDLPSEFSNNRVNPLFWSSVSPPDQEIESRNALPIAKLAETASRVGRGASKSASSAPETKRGRSVTRNSAVVDEKFAGGRRTIGRSLSRVDRGCRGRSASRGHYSTSEGEVGQESTVSSINASRSYSNLLPNDVNAACSERLKFSTAERTQRLVIEPSVNCASSMPVPNWEDGISMGSLSETEEKTIKAVSEQMESFPGNHLGGDTAASGIYETVRSEVRRAISDIQNDLELAIRKSNATAIATTNIANLPPDLVNPGAVELVLDIRREYARKLEESQERARKLRADLAVEEHREQELSRILKEILPNPKATNGQKSRSGRKASSERKKISKCLTEEALAYFDECVSISTFDGSDFSAPEDPSFNSVGASATPAIAAATLPQESPSVLTSYPADNYLRRNQLDSSRADSGLTANSSSWRPMIDEATDRGIGTGSFQKFQFSVSRKPTETIGIENDIRNCIKSFERDSSSEIKKPNYYDLDGYNSQGHTQSLLLDRVFFKNRIESGNIHLCGGGFAISFSPFASVI